VDAPQIALAEALVRARALEAGLAYELVAARSDLAAIVASVRRRDAQPEVRTLAGWRGELVGDELLAMLRGERSLSVGGQGRLEITATPASEADLENDPPGAPSAEREPAAGALTQRRSS
jgi:ribonuclease D